MGPICVTLPNFIKIGQTVAEILRFNSFHNVGRPPSWILEIKIFLTVWALKRPILHNRANFAKTGQSIVVISQFLWFFTIAAAAILFFEKFEILTVCPL